MLLATTSRLRLYLLQLNRVKCFLHIGTAKTATTTIQSFFRTNRKQLLSRGYIYTSSAGSGNNYLLAHAAYGKHRLIPITAARYLDIETTDVTSLKRLVLKGLANEIKSALRWNPDASILFSSENIHLYMPSIDELQSLKSILGSLGVTEICIIVYLRRPADIAKSFYAMTVLAGSCRVDIPSPETRFMQNLCNHRMTIERFSQVFGEENIVPRVFDEGSFINGSVIEDFLHLIGIEKNDFIMPPNENLGLSALGVQILLRINQKITESSILKQNIDGAEINHYIARYLTGNTFKLQHEDIDRYEKAFSQSNNWVRDKYFPERDWLFAPRKLEAPIQALSHKEVDRLADLMLSVWNFRLKESPASD